MYQHVSDLEVPRSAHAARRESVGRSLNRIGVRNAAQRAMARGVRW